jgi:hypothetical protein
MTSSTNVHVHRLESSGEPNETRLAGLDHDVAGTAFNRKSQEVLNQLGMCAHRGRETEKRCDPMGVVWFAPQVFPP